MRNLRCTHYDAIPGSFGLPFAAAAWDTVNDAVISAYGPTRSQPIIELRRTQSNKSNISDSEILASWDALSPLPDLEQDKILSLYHFGHNDASCLVLAGGDIVVVRHQAAPGEEKIEIVGSVDAGITAACWSPDEELLLITTRADTVLFMTADFDIAGSVAFVPEDVKLSKHVSVGWGKSETQFKGRGARALRDPTMPEKVDEGKLSPLDAGQVTISWRGDGAFVAVNSIEGGVRRMIRVYSREGVLDSVSEPVDGLEGSLSWRPSGNLLASVQRWNDQTNVVFFERNGLRHGEFSLRLDKDKSEEFNSSIDLKWNIDSTTLAVSYPGRCQLWTMNNYHYYLKQDLRISEMISKAPPVTVTWHPEAPLRVTLGHTEAAEDSEGEDVRGHEFQRAGSTHSLEFVFSTSVGSKSGPFDFGTTVVIDGRILRVTPLRLANVPPPMALHEIQLQSNAIDVAVNQSSSQIAVLHNDAVSLIRYAPKVRDSEQPTIVSTVSVPTSSTLKAVQICYVGAADIFVLMANLEEYNNLIYHISASSQTGTQLNVPSNATSIFPAQNHDFVCVSNDDVVSKVTVGSSPDGSPYGGFVDLGTICKFPDSSPWVEVVTVNDETIAFGLSTTGVLYANERLLLRNCTSFLTTQSHLIVTTTNHLLKFIHLTSVSGLEVPSDEPETDERCRSVERGAKLVNVMPTSYSLTLQMPRGNLETIFPRALVLAGIRRSIAAKNYKKAFMACRNQRVDMNILHDHAPKQFLNNVSLIVEQLGKVEYIDLFLSQLRNEDVSETMYKETLPQSMTGGTEIKPSTDKQDTSKVDRICDAFLATLESKFTTNLQNVISAHVCKSPPDIRAGLRVISKLHQDRPELADTAVEHICFLADVNQVYDQALGLYDLDLALLVAQQSQKDPREYLPYMQSLQEMTQLRKQFTIDDHLGKPTQALSHLYSLDVFDEFTQYMEKHELYKEALSMYQYRPDEQASITRLYADYLISRNKYAEAAIALDSLQEYSRASEAYRAANLWRESLASGLLAQLPDDDLTTLAESLAETLTESKDFASAAIIHLDHLSDLEGAVRLYCRGYQFAEATRLLGLHKRPELLTSTIDPCLIEGSASMTELLAECKTQLGAQVPRLRELRKLKAADPLAFYDGVDGPDIPDNVSLAPTSASTSGGTLFTRYTNRTGTTLNTTTTRKTSKNRRREERKRARGKKGSVYEEEYLVNSVGRLVERVNGVGEDVQRLVESLLRRNMRERALAVENAMVEVGKACRECLAEVYEIEEKKAVVEAGEEEVRVSGADAVWQDSVEESKVKKEAPVVKAFQRSPLLDG